ncbi:MFS transporter [Paenibacillus sp. 7124]|uniref:MFS transporter n=1 Tax=Paenibacillus apii TaxID=1850370 RepID=A0A6M1PH84_9BACL|nr:MFS transporter [Paenibacillus apii]NGM82586.1 MFS transporter [Paenibacillus apii]
MRSAASGERTGTGKSPAFSSRRTLFKALGPLLAAYSLASLGSYIFDIGIIVELYRRTGSPAAVGGYFIIQFLPALLLTPALGTFIDRWSRKRILLWTNLARALTVGVLLIHLSVETIYAAAVLLGICDEIYAATANAIGPELAGPEDLPRFNSLLSASDSINLIAGPAIAGLCVSLGGTRASIGADAAVFALAALLVLLMPYRTPRKAAEAAGFLDEMKEGLRIVSGEPVVQKMLLVWGLLLAGVGSTGSLIVVFIGGTMGLPAEKYGWVMAFQGAGIITGSVWIMSRKKAPRPGRLILLGMTLIGVGLLAVSAAGTLAVLLGAYLLIGLGAAAAPNGIRSTLQSELDPGVLGRVFITARFVVNTVRTLSIGAASLIAGITGLRVVFAAAALCVLLGGSAAYVMGRRAGKAEESGINVIGKN